MPAGRTTKRALRPSGRWRTPRIGGSVRGVAAALVLALVAAACSNGDDVGADSVGTDSNSAESTAAAANSFPQEPDPGDPDGFAPPDTGPGLHWERVDHPGFSLGFVVWSSTQFVTVNTRSDGSTELLTSPDGVTWTDAGQTFDDIEVRDLAVSREALAVWGETRGSMTGDPTGNIARIHFSPDNGATWHQRDIRHPDLGPDDDNPGSQIVTAAVRGTTVLVSAFFRSEEAGYLLSLDLSDDDPRFEPVELDPPGTFVGDITVTAGGIILIGADLDSSRIYTEGADGFDRVDPDTRVATLLSDGRVLYANNWESYDLLISRDLGATWTPVDQNEAWSFSQTFVGPAGMAGTDAIGSDQPWAVITDDGSPTLGAEPVGRTRAETLISWSADGSAWHHETATSAFGYPAFAYLAIGDDAVLAVATPLFGGPYEEGTVATELWRSEVDR